MPETSLTCPSCTGRISTFRLETGRGSGICCECTNSYDIAIKTVGEQDEVRTIDLTCRRTGKRSFHLQLHQACQFRRWLVPVGWLAMAGLALTLVIFTSLALVNVFDRGFRAMDLQILTAPFGLYLLAMLSRTLTMTEQLSVTGDSLTWTKSTLLRQRRQLKINDIAATDHLSDGDERSIRLRTRAGASLHVGEGLSLAGTHLDWTCSQLRKHIRGIAPARVSVPATASSNQSHDHIWTY